jgi:hypothetical protein
MLHVERITIIEPIQSNDLSVNCVNSFDLYSDSTNFESRSGYVLFLSPFMRNPG